MTFDPTKSYLEPRPIHAVVASIRSTLKSHDLLPPVLILGQTEQNALAEELGAERGEGDNAEFKVFLGFEVVKGPDGVVGFGWKVNPQHPEDGHGQEEIRRAGL